MNLDAVIKVGGSLSRGGGLKALCREIGRLGRKRLLLVVPGGGTFADRVREAYRTYRLSETAAHRMALSAMDQYGYVLHDLIPDSVLLQDMNSSMPGSHQSHHGKAVILLPSATVNKADSLPHSWEVTSDSVAAWVALQMRCSRLILVKDVDGLLPEPSGPPTSEIISEMTVEQLAHHRGGIDGYLHRLLESSRLETWIINGLFPERLSGLLDSGSARGTRISPPMHTQ